MWVFTVDHVQSMAEIPASLKPHHATIKETPTISIPYRITRTKF